MDGMASVLFVVTIPTAAEEQRLKLEFLAKNDDLIKSEQSDDMTTTTIDKFPLKIDSTKTAATTTSKIFGLENCCENEDQVVNDLGETISTTIIDNVPMESGEVMRSIPNDTFPKAKKSGEKTNILEELPVDVSDVDIDTTNSLTPTRNSWESIKDILSTAKRKNLKKKAQHIDLQLEQDICMEAVLREILKKFHIHGATWAKDAEGLMYQIFFTVEFNETYEKILYSLNEWGIGDRVGSTVSVMNCITSKTYSQKVDNEIKNDLSTKKNLTQKQSAWERFMNSVRSRLNVANIIRDVRQDAAITFDFVILLISATILASFGLVENSTIFLASSMLISPLMGPIIAAIFGTVIKDHSLRRLGIKNELLGILMAVLVGFLFGMIIYTIDYRYSIGEGLTDEMMARCELRSLIVGVFTAITSGAAAAIGILGGNIGSLVGVAISASLLPPAVNSGLLWALAVIYTFFEKDGSRYNSVVKNTIYSSNQANELAILGFMSMCLTISNVICIYIMGILVLKVKEVAPVISRNNREFWKHDIKIARDLNRSGFDTDTAIIDEFASLNQEDQRALGISCDFLRNIPMDDTIYQNTWSPIGAPYYLESSYDPIKMNYSTVHRIERLYSTITGQQEKSCGVCKRGPNGHVTEFGTSCKILNENIPSCPTISTNFVCPTINIVTADATIMAGVAENAYSSNTSTGTSNEQKRRTFIVTPAEEDPLYSAYMRSENADV